MIPWASSSMDASICTSCSVSHPSLIVCRALSKWTRCQMMGRFSLFVSCELEVESLLDQLVDAGVSLDNPNCVLIQACQGSDLHVHRALLTCPVGPTVSGSQLFSG